MGTLMPSFLTQQITLIGFLVVVVVLFVSFSICYLECLIPSALRIDQIGFDKANPEACLQQSLKGTL